MSEIEPTIELSQIEAKVATLCDGALAGRNYYLLSELGKALGEDLERLKIVGKLKLADFIEARLRDRFSVVSVGRGNVKAVVHSGLPAAGAWTPAVAAPPNAQAPAAKVRYHYRFWAAFAVPNAGRHRYLDPEELTFEDRDQGQAPEGHLEIAERFMTPDGIDHRDEAIMEKIQGWLNENGLPRERFLEGNERFRSAGAAAGHVLRGTTVLDAVLAALDKRQLATTSLSLDIVAALLRKRI